MSSLITLKLPFIDHECVMDALKELKLEATEIGDIIEITKERIQLVKTPIGYVTNVNYLQERIVNKLYTVYEKKYTQKINRLQEQNRILQALNEKQRIQSQNLLKIQEEQKKKELQKEIEKIEAEKKIKLAEIEKLRIENEELQKIKIKTQEALAQKIQETIKEYGHVSTQKKVDNRIRISIKLN